MVANERVNIQIGNLKQLLLEVYIETIRWAIEWQLLTSEVIHIGCMHQHLYKVSFKIFVKGRGGELGGGVKGGGARTRQLPS